MGFARWSQAWLSGNYGRLRPRLVRPTLALVRAKTNSDPGLHPYRAQFQPPDPRHPSRGPGQRQLSLHRHTPWRVGWLTRLRSQATSQGSRSNSARLNRLPCAPQWGQRSTASSPNSLFNHSGKICTSNITSFDRIDSENCSRKFRDLIEGTGQCLNNDSNGCNPIIAHKCSR